MKIFFWLSLFIVFYTFLGYGIVLYILVLIRRAFKGKRLAPGLDQEFPTLTLVIAAYNEESIIEEKIANTLQLSYPAGKLSVIFVTDGSSDRTPELVAKYPEIKLMHTPVRSGKILAMHRAMDEVNSEVVVFTDANTFLNKEALLLIARHYADLKVGAVSGEKRVMQDALSDATAGEGFYWKYESTLKKWDSELYSVVGAAGELFSVRRSLYRSVEPDTIVDDFMISMRIAEQGYRIVYEPEAYASELSSENIKEELKRKVRIAAGGMQSILRLQRLLNPFHDPLLTFQYISHRVLRWTVTPFLMILALVLNILIVMQSGGVIYQILLAGQVVFYGLALAGWVLETQKIKVKALFVPYYFCMMNYAVMAGIRRYFKGSQSAAWEKAKRKSA
ncbi:glycosyltransferase family 2 protein [Dyadobacter jiangsuensis]|uniref:Cellulose synthase/poly-beta-1,6-N-acetylglucosamine synthase-like glycosyltransferase n=1 Tax=Dyadobacter jiangsuensis TaxID=1591085 RepID=A0A2P8G8B3_9BACT|nr:glycosyltransferase family 2 protein [Dyadobacter jiangsuensis]PSL30188.1 cellulose synthase/poly-beta-1,6-N-acetylglucosamine synthase-like glycosyltransferase [Dyadobacter jiangsuensis]